MKRVLFLLVVVAFAGLLLPDAVHAQAIPGISLNVGQTDNPEKVVSTLQIVGLLTLMALAPMLVLMMTSFTRLIIVFHFLRQAMGAAQVPPAQLIVGLAMVLTFYIMSPTLNKINETALQPYLQGNLDQKTALAEAVKPMKDFMLAQVREKDLALFINMSGHERPADETEIGLGVLVPAYVISELRIAFQIGFVLYLPFLIIDMVVSSVLLAMGMMMLPPSLISLPFKLLLFVMTDGWFLIAQSLLSSFN